MKRFVKIGMCLCLMLILSACCNRAIQYQGADYIVEGVDIPFKIGGTEIPLKVAKFSKETKSLREASEIAQILDNRQYANCQLVKSLPKDERKELTLQIQRDQAQLDKLAIIFSTTKDENELDEKTIKWVEETTK